MSASKGALKAINASILAKKWAEAVAQSQNFLRTDSSSYQANLFLGFASDKLNYLSDAETAYGNAAAIKPEDPQAWQGLIKLYERQGSENVTKYQKAALNLAEIYRDLDDKYRCQDVIDKFMAFAKTQGSRQQYRKSLDLVLPTSPIYDFLEGRIAHPSRTFENIAQITEADEKEKINKEIGERRTRLGAKITQVTLEVRREVFQDSPLEELYQEIINWSNDDEIRRRYEEKLLQRCYDAMVALRQKDDKRAKARKLAADMVIIKHPFKLAWDIDIEWKDYTTIEEYDVSIWREYVALFPEAGLARIIAGYLASDLSPFPSTPQTQKGDENPREDSDESDNEDEEGGVPLIGALTTPEERMLVMTDGMADASGSILAHRLMGDYYASVEEHESVVELMRPGLNLVSEESLMIGLGFDNSRQSLTGLLGTALVFYQSPKNHPEAKALFQEMMERDSTATAALIGIGLIFEDEEDFPAALSFLDRALEKDPANIRVRAEAAWVQALNGNYTQSKELLERCLLGIEAKNTKSRELRAQIQHRIGTCLWHIKPSRAERKNRAGAYAYHLAALKSDLNFAPAYTSLGIFYSDYSNDRKRARKCFQKAFELSSSEIESARRLAQDFADSGEWDLVEAVSQRVIESGRVKPAPGSKKRGLSWPFASLGVAQLNKQDYSNSVVSFQSALRISPGDYYSWVGLAESYHNLGRYVAATKAFAHASKFEAEVEHRSAGDTWFARYMVANVKRELGLFDEAIHGFRSALDRRPNEFGVSIALISTLVDSAYDAITKGLFGQAADRANESIRLAQTMITTGKQDFNYWKAVGDSCSLFSWVQSRLKHFPRSSFKDILQTGANEEASNFLHDVDGVEIELVYSDEKLLGAADLEANLTQCLQASIISHKHAIFAASHDTYAQAVAYYNLGCAEYRAHTCLISRMSTKTKSTKYLQAAIRCFKRSIELEAGNADFWNALGVVTSELAPRVAQHSLIRSLFLNERSAQTWTNLGNLYLTRNDTELAYQAFTRGQSADPEFAGAWVGQGLLALLLGEAREARLLFTHALEISDSSNVITKRQYVLSTFDQLLSSVGISLIDLINPNFAISQLNNLLSGELAYQHLAALFLERIENVSGAMAKLNDICSSAEADYEETESPSAISRFALCKADLARSQLADGKYTDAADTAETSLQLSADDAGNDLSQSSRQRCRLSAHLTLGLAYYHMKRNEMSVKSIKEALSEFQGNPHTTCVLAQVLWATGEDQSREDARDQLFECVESNPGHVQAILLLGCISILDEDMDTLDAVLADLEALRMSDEISDHDRDMAGEILRAAATLSERPGSRASLAEVQSGVFFYPWQSQTWSRLADIDGNEFAADMALKTAIKSVPPGGELEAKDLSSAFAGTDKLRDAQVAVTIAPWKFEGWNNLSTALKSVA